jgi:hypothetical protein
MSGFNNTTPDPDVRSQIANNAPDPQSRYLAQTSNLYRRLDDLKKNETLVIITKRARLATLAQCRESLVPKGVEGNRARDANLKLFRAIFPQHATVEAVVAARLSYMTEKYNLLPTNYFGARPRRSAEQALNVLVGGSIRHGGAARFSR